MFSTNNELDAANWSVVAHAMRAVLNGAPRQRYTILTAAGGYIYDRKGNLTTDLFGQRRNRVYGRDADDIVLSLTLTIPSVGCPDAVQVLKRDAENFERDSLRDRLAAAEAAAEAAAATAARLREQLNGLDKP